MSDPLKDQFMEQLRKWDEQTKTSAGIVTECSIGIHKKPTARDTQVGGSHYKDLKVQPWDAMECWLTANQFQGYLLGNALKYIARFNALEPGKGGIQDIKKAKHYLDKLVEVCEKYECRQG